MADDSLVRARKRAEHAVAGMAEGPLKTAAFQTILAKLLADADVGEQVQPPPSRALPGRKQQPRTLTERILAIRSEGFFKPQRSLSEVREALGSRGWHYPLTTLSGVMQALVRRRELRRERVSVGNKQVWKYSNA
ncbi:MAG: hypothetical protein DMG48_02785 [Acidobacteria bacterium]|nr:MAG: hypothetical protein DMG48_02785 [Acidobacteriota bacterium]